MTSPPTVWLANIPDSCPADALRVCLDLLDSAEKERAERFRVEPARVQYVAAHAMVRLALSADRPGVSPTAWRFGRGPFGKPNVAGGGPAFSLSHTSGMAGCAVAAMGDIGFDVERWDRPINLVTMEAVLAAAEKAELEALNEPVQRRRFFELWTAKEAAAKACGRGLSAGLKTVRIERRGGHYVATGTAGEWQIKQAAAGESHLFALAASQDVEPRVHRLTFVELIEAAVHGAV